MVDLYSSDTVKGTVEEYAPAFGKCALKNGGLCCPSLQVFHAPVAYVLCISEGKLLFLGSSECLLSERRRWRHPVSCENTEWAVTNLDVDGSNCHFSLMFNTNLFGQQTSFAQYELLSAFLNLKYYLSDRLASIFRTAIIIIAFLKNVFSFFS